jgi:MoxR-like ATPase
MRRLSSAEHVDFVRSTEKITEIQSEIERVVKGKSETIRLAICALLAGGHILVEDVPGVGKTTLANALARTLDCKFQRIQFTSDMLPSDVIGISVYNQGTSQFEWRQGPVFANILLADEINRTTPKTQSALLESMAEGQVTVEGHTYQLPDPFMVVATQNPVEHHGTYPLPESQLDRFLLRIRIGYPDVESEKEILRDRAKGDPLEEVKPVARASDIITLRRYVTSVRMDESLMDYLMNIVKATRVSEMLEMGVSPRASLALFRAAQSRALMEGRDFCIPDDIKSMVSPVFSHRLVVSSRFSSLQQKNNDGEVVLQEILKSISVPL